MSYYIAEGAIVRGQVEIGDGVSIWYNTTVRGDREPISLGNNTNVQDNAVIHVDTDYPTVIGQGVTIGHGAIVHGCRVDDNSLIGMGAIIMNGATIGKNCIIAAGAIVTQNMAVPDNSLVVGSPGKVRRQVTEEEVQSIRDNASHYVMEGEKQLMRQE